MQTVTVMKGDPSTLAEDLTTLAASEEIKVVVKTFSSGTFLVISEAPSTGQTAQVVKGDPTTIADALPLLGDVGILVETFSASQYVAVYV